MEEQVGMIEKDAAIKIMSLVGVVGNLVLSAFKLLAGIFGHSAAMLSDAIHSFSDVASTLVAYIGVSMAEKAADHEHPYGHERLECVASMILADILLLTGLGIGYSAARQIFSPDPVTTTPGVIALIAAGVSIAVKEWMFWYTRALAKKIHSEAFMADAWHHRSDALSSVGALIGIGAARLGWPILDPIAGLVICLFILKAGIDIFRKAVSGVTDRACSDDFEARVSACVLEDPDVYRIDLLHSRLFGDRVYVDLELGLDGSNTLEEAHRIAERVHLTLEDSFPEIKHVTTHMNPVKVSKKGK